MVRNTASMQSLRENMADCTMHSPPSTQPRPSSQQQNAPVSLTQPAQIVGSDAYTKWLMTRVATGVATPEEQAMWQQHVNLVKSKPTTTQSAQSTQAQTQPNLEARQKMLAARQALLNDNPPQAFSPEAPLVAPNYPEGTSPAALQDYQVQLMLLEQQNKKRDLRAINEAKEMERASQSISHAPTPQREEPIDPACVAHVYRLLRERGVDPEASSSYDIMQLARLPADQRMKSVEAQIANNERTTKPFLDSPPQSTIPSQASPAFAPPSSFMQAGHREAARQDYEMQLMLLEQQNRKRLQLAKQNQPTQPNPIAGVYAGPFVSGMNPNLMNKTEGIPANMRPEMAKAEQDANAAWASGSKFHQKLAANRTKPTAIGAGPFAAVTHRAEAPAVDSKQAIRKTAAKYAEPFCKFLAENPTVFHAVDAVKKQLKEAGFKALSERDSWDLEAGGSYFVERNGSALIAFSVGSNYKSGNGAAILAGHVDALTAKLKPISQVPNKAGYLQLGVAPYAGAPNTTWWDRDLGIGGRVLVKEGDKIVSKLVKLDWPIARIPTLAPHFGAAAYGPFNPETQMVPIIGLDNTDSHASAFQTAEPFSNPPLMGGASGGVSGFVATQPRRLVKAIGNALGLRIDTYSNIVNWELELYDVQPATLGGLDKEFIYAGRIDDKLCSWAAVQALVESKDEIDNSSQIKMVGLFDDEEIGSLLRQGAHGNFLPTVMERAVSSLAGHSPGSDIMGRTYANSFLVSSDVTHAVNPNFLGAYLENHSPHLNVGVVVSADSNGHMTTDAISTAILKRCADKVGAQLQVFQIRNDSRSGGTVGPMLSSATGMRSVDAGIPQLSMHSIRATTGSLDPGLGVHCFKGFLNGFEAVDKEFRD